MQELLNEAIIPMLNDGLISMRRVSDLISIKEFIDRVSTKKYIEDKDAGAANLALQKSQNILNYLRATLDMKYEVSQSLSSLYDFFIRQVIAANVRKDAAPLLDIIPLIGELKDTFTQAEKLARISQQPMQAVPSGVVSAIG